MDQEKVNAVLDLAVVNGDSVVSQMAIVLFLKDVKLAMVLAKMKVAQLLKIIQVKRKRKK